MSRSVRFLLALALISGCKSSEPTTGPVDPFFGRTRVPPPATGAIVAILAATLPTTPRVPIRSALLLTPFDPQDLRLRRTGSRPNPRLGKFPQHRRFPQPIPSRWAQIRAPPPRRQARRARWRRIVQAIELSFLLRRGTCPVRHPI